MLIPLRLSAQTDEQLMQRAAHGNDRAFEELYNRHARRLQGFFRRRLGERQWVGEQRLGIDELAADLMHDTFLRLYDARHRYREGQVFRPWLYTIAYNLCKNYMRGPHPQPLSQGEGSDCLGGTDADVEVELDAALLREALREVLRRRRSAIPAWLTAVPAAAVAGFLIGIWTNSQLTTDSPLTAMTDTVYIKVKEIVPTVDTVYMPAPSSSAQSVKPAVVRQKSAVPALPTTTGQPMANDQIRYDLLVKN